MHSRGTLPAVVQLDLSRPRTDDERYLGVPYAPFKENTNRWDNGKDLLEDFVMMPHPVMRFDAKGLPVPVTERNECGFVPSKSWHREVRKCRHILNLFFAYRNREEEYYMATALKDRYTEFSNDWHKCEA